MFKSEFKSVKLDQLMHPLVLELERSTPGQLHSTAKSDDRFSLTWEWVWKRQLRRSDSVSHVMVKLQTLHVLISILPLASTAFRDCSSSK